MRSKLVGPIKLAEAVKTLRDGAWKDLLEFEEDEELWMRSPFSRPNIHRLENNKEFTKFATKPEDDPERMAFVAQKNKEGTVYCIAKWTVKGEDGTPLPLPSLDDMAGTWETLGLDHQMFISALIDDHWFPQPKAEAEDPKEPSNESSTEPKSDGPTESASSPPSEEIVIVPSSSSSSSSDSDSARNGSEAMIAARA